MLYDRMTECVYAEPLRSFSNNLTPEAVQVVPVLSQGRAALETINATRGLGFDDWDLDFYTSVFRDKLKRDPTDVELFDIGECSLLVDFQLLGFTDFVFILHLTGQSNSEHSRHWFFSGQLHIDEKEHTSTTGSTPTSTPTSTPSLFQLVKSTLPPHSAVAANSVIAFHDNSSALRGSEVDVLVPRDPSRASEMRLQRRLLHPILTAETHNFPT